MVTILFHNEEYDISSFVDKHPGGSHVFQNMDNTDITPIVYSYHTNMDKVKNILKQYKCNKESTDNEKRIQYKDETNYEYDLYLKLKEKSKNLLTPSTKKWSVSNWLYHSTMFVVYCLGWYQTIISLTIFNSIFLGVMGIAWGGLIQHEASHGAISIYPWINYIGRWFVVPFGSPSMWHLDHNIKHHPHTNLDLDGDFSVASTSKVARFSLKQPYHPWYSFQLFYLMILLNPVLAFVKGPLRSMFIVTGNDPNIQDSSSKKEALFHLVIFSSWVGYHYSHQSIIYPIITICVYSIIFMIFSQVNHISESSVDLPTNRSNDFCINQIESSVNYKTNFITKFLSFGLHAQIEHHLFPSLSHEHYDKLKHIVKEFAKENNIKYVEKDSFWDALKSYVITIWKCSLS